MNEKKLKEVLENHKHWLNEDCDGWNNMRGRPQRGRPQQGGPRKGRPRRGKERAVYSICLP